MATKKETRRFSIKKRIRKKISGTQDRPRLSVFRSNTAIYGQIIDDAKGLTLVSASSRELSEKAAVNVSLAKEVGKKLAERAKEKGLTSIVFDRNGFLYHGKIKSLAEGAREGGLEF
jgi:large subunit ribosomal protein L18